MAVELVDRQLVRTLRYLRDRLEADDYLARQHDLADRVVATCLAREPIESVKGGQLRMHTTGLPVLALYWEGGVIDPDASVNNFGDKRRFKLQYLARLPGDERDNDRWAVARAWIYNVWWTILRALYHAEFSAVCNSAMIRSVTPGKYNFIPLWGAGLAMLDATVDIEHLSPPYDPDELDDLVKIVADLDLYNEGGSTASYTKEFEVAI